MHEVGICQSIFEALEAELTELQLSRLQQIHLRIGILSGIEPQILIHVYQFMVADSLFHKATLHIETVEVTAECKHCAHSFAVNNYQFICPQCHEASGQLVRGNELEIYKLILEIEEEPSNEKVNQ